MLKIRDGVDLKQLEKFGFNINKHYDLFTRYEYKSDSSTCLYIDEARVLSIFPTHYDKLEPRIMNKLFDLIQAGLVEKVEDK